MKDIIFLGDLFCAWSWLAAHNLWVEMQKRGHQSESLQILPLRSQPNRPITGLDWKNLMQAHSGDSNILKLIADELDQQQLPHDLSAINQVGNSATAFRYLLAAPEDQQLACYFKLQQAFFTGAIDGCSEMEISYLMRQYTDAAVDMEIFNLREAKARRFDIKFVPATLFKGEYWLGGVHQPHAYGPLLDLIRAI